MVGEQKVLLLSLDKEYVVGELRGNTVGGLLVGGAAGVVSKAVERKRSEIRDIACADFLRGLLDAEVDHGAEVATRHLVDLFAETPLLSCPAKTKVSLRRLSHDTRPMTYHSPQS